MKASQLIEELQALINKHGDLECQDSYGERIDSPEFNTDDGEVFVVADKA